MRRPQRRIRRQIEARSRAVRILEHHRPFRHHRLAIIEQILLQLPHAEHLVDRREDAFVEMERTLQHLRNDFPSDVVARRTQSARDEDHVAAGECLGQDRADLIAIGDRRLALHPQAKLEEFLPEVGRVRVHDFAEEQFRAGVDDFEAHGKAVRERGAPFADQPCDAAGGVGRKSSATCGASDQRSSSR
jgi:hypothetical protein